MSSNGAALEFTGFEFSVIRLNPQENTSERWGAQKLNANLHIVCFTVVFTEETTGFVTVPWEVQHLAYVLSHAYLLTLFFKVWDGLETEIATVLLGVFAVSSQIVEHVGDSW